MPERPRYESYEGLFVAVTTPFDADDRVDGDAFRAHIEYLLEGGINGLVPCGTSGEAATMSRAEKKATIAAAVSAVAGRVPVVAGVGTNATAATIEYAKDALEVGADGLLVVTPYYNKPPQQGLYAHYKAVAEATGAPIVIYNVPGRTAVSIAPETIARLAGLPQIVAVKEATGDMVVGSHIAALCGSRLSLLSGDDFTALPFMAIGGRGAISVLGNVDPARTGKMLRSALAGDYDTARALHYELLPLTRALFQTTNPIPVKAAVSLLGFGRPDVRAPLSPLDDAGTERLGGCMRVLGLL